MRSALLVLLVASAYSGTPSADVAAWPTEDELSIYRFPWPVQKYCSRRSTLIDEKTSVIKSTTTETREYDSHGRLRREQTEDSDGSKVETRLAYDGTSTVREERTSNGKSRDVIVYRLDPNGRIASLRHEDYSNGATPVDHTVQAKRDVHGHLETWTDGKMKSECQLGHDGAGRLTFRRCQSGRRGTPVSNSNTFTYDRQGLLIEYTSDDKLIHERCAIVREENGQPVASICRGGAMVSHFRTMFYDRVGNLVEELDEGFPVHPMLRRIVYDYSCWPATAPAPNDVALIF